MALLARIEQGGAEERGAERVRLRLNSPGEIGAGSDTDSVTVHELSATGFLIQTETPLAVGETIAFTLPVAGTVAGEIVWASGHYLGGQFRSPLPPGVLQAALAESRVVWPNFAPRSAADRADQVPAPLRTGAALLDDAESNASKFSLPVRFQIIAGTSLLLWTLIGVTLWLLIQAL